VLWCRRASDRVLVMHCAYVRVASTNIALHPDGFYFLFLCEHMCMNHNQGKVIMSHMNVSKLLLMFCAAVWQALCNISVMRSFIPKYVFSFDHRLV